MFELGLCKRPSRMLDDHVTADITERCNVRMGWQTELKDHPARRIGARLMPAVRFGDRAPDRQPQAVRLSRVDSLHWSCCAKNKR